MIAVEGAPLCLPRKPMERLPKALLPQDTCDTHFHVFRPGAPLATPRSYTPQMHTLADWQAYAQVVNIGRGVLVQPSVYGFDNRVLIETLAADICNLRGIAVLPAETSQEKLRELDQRGVRGIRVNTRNKGGLALSAVPELATRMAELGWLLQFQIHPEQLAEIGRLASVLPCPIVLDHLGFIPRGTRDAAGHLSALQHLLDTGICYVKLSAPYRLDTGPDFFEFGALARRLAGSHPERLLWGSDWPHTELWHDMPDDTNLVDLMQDWLSDAESSQRVFVANAEALFFSR